MLLEFFFNVFSFWQNLISFSVSTKKSWETFSAIYAKMILNLPLFTDEKFFRFSSKTRKVQSRRTKKNKVGIRVILQHYLDEKRIFPSHQSFGPKKIFQKNTSVIFLDFLGKGNFVFLLLLSRTDAFFLVIFFFQ